jgi:hypothetical protein
MMFQRNAVKITLVALLGMASASGDNTTTTTVTPSACTNVTTAVNVTTTNSTDNTTTTTLQQVTECVTPSSDSTAATTSSAPVVAANNTKILGRLTVGFTVPDGTTAASLNSNSAFKNAMAATIQEALQIEGADSQATVTVPFVKVPGSADPVTATTTAAASTATTTGAATTAATTTTAEATTTTAGSRLLLEEVVADGSIKRVLQGANDAPRVLTTTTLDLEIAYEIVLPKSAASAVYTKIGDKTNFQTLVKQHSTAKFAAAGLTGFTVDTVVAADATGDMAPATNTQSGDGATDAEGSTTEAPTSGANTISKLSVSSVSTAMLVASMVFSRQLF